MIFRGAAVFALASSFAVASHASPTPLTSLPSSPSTSPARTLVTPPPRSSSTPRFPTSTRRLVAGDILLKLDALDEKTLRDYHRGDAVAKARAKAVIDASVNELRAVVPSLRFVRKLPAGWGLFRADALVDEPSTERAVAALKKHPSVTHAVVNRWLTAMRVANAEVFT